MKLELADYGDLIKKFRDDYVMTQAELADEIGLSSANLSRILNLGDIKLSRLCEILDVFNADLVIEYEGQRHYLNKGSRYL